MSLKEHIGQRTEQGSGLNLIQIEKEGQKR